MNGTQRNGARGEGDSDYAQSGDQWSESDTTDDSTMDSPADSVEDRTEVSTEISTVDSAENNEEFSDELSVGWSEGDSEIAITDRIPIFDGEQYSEEGMLAACLKWLNLDHSVPIHRITQYDWQRVWLVGHNYVASWFFTTNEETVTEASAYAANCLVRTEDMFRDLIRAYYRKVLFGEEVDESAGREKSYPWFPITRDSSEIDPIPETFFITENTILGEPMRFWICYVDYQIRGASLAIFAANERTESGLVLLLRVLKSIPPERHTDSFLGSHDARVEPDVDAETASAQFAWERLMENNQLQSQLEVVQGDPPPLRLTLPNTPNVKSPDASSTEADSGHVVLHNALKEKKILVDPTTGGVKGIVGWSHVATGDPAVDIAGLSISAGARMAARVATKAGYDDRTVARGIILGRCGAIKRLDERFNGNDSGPVHLLWQRLKLSLEVVEWDVSGVMRQG